MRSVGQTINKKRKKQHKQQTSRNKQEPKSNQRKNTTKHKIQAISNIRKHQTAHQIINITSTKTTNHKRQTVVIYCIITIWWTRNRRITGMTRTSRYEAYDVYDVWCIWHTADGILHMAMSVLFHCQKIMRAVRQHILPWTWQNGCNRQPRTKQENESRWQKEHKSTNKIRCSSNVFGLSAKKIQSPPKDGITTRTVEIAKKTNIALNNQSFQKKSITSKKTMIANKKSPL